MLTVHRGDRGMPEIWTIHQSNVVSSTRGETVVAGKLGRCFGRESRAHPAKETRCDGISI
jgi:hypothetical protein